VLAFDFGTRRVGVAVGNTLVRAAHALTTIDEARSEPRFAAIGELVEQWQPGSFIVGLPVHADGSEHELTERARRFARQLEGRFRRPVAFVDERYTSEEATAMQAQRGRGGRQHRPERDAIAAQIILQAWFDDRSSAA
jgi:putative Holliday junction resolvase